MKAHFPLSCKLWVHSESRSLSMPSLVLLHTLSSIVCIYSQLETQWTLEQFTIALIMIINSI